MKSKSFSLIIRNKIKDYSRIITPDSDKSISIRSFIISSISQNISYIYNALESDESVFMLCLGLRSLIQLQLLSFTTSMEVDYDNYLLF